MTTTKLNLPTISGNMTADVVRDINALAEAVDVKVGVAGGLATLDGNGKVPAGQSVDASTTAKGIVQLEDSTASVSTTKAATPNSVKTVNDSLATHQADDIKHNISVKVSKTNKDVNGIFTTIEHRRKTDNTLARKSIFSGGTSPQYTTRTVTYYGADGTTVVKTDTFTLSYDADGDFISEV